MVLGGGRWVRTSTELGGPPPEAEEKRVGTERWAYLVVRESGALMLGMLYALGPSCLHLHALLRSGSQPR